MARTVRSSKGFLFEADDTPRPVLCRDVRGFPAAASASLDRSLMAPDRVVIVVPDLAMEDWLARWADDVGHPRRSLTVTRRTDGQQIRIVGTLLAYGYGVDTAIQVERLEYEPRSQRTRSTSDEAPKSGIPDLPSMRKQVAPIRRRASR
jgi:hypothetical protein